MQELEQRVIEADQRAETAEKQVFISSTTGDAGTQLIFFFFKEKNLHEIFGIKKKHILTLRPTYERFPF